MDTRSKKRETLPPQELRSSRGRQSSGIVPAAARSSSYDGPLDACPAGASREDTPAMTGVRGKVASGKRGSSIPAPLNGQSPRTTKGKILEPMCHRLKISSSQLTTADEDSQMAVTPSGSERGKMATDKVSVRSSSPDNQDNNMGDQEKEEIEDLRRQFAEFKREKEALLKRVDALEQENELLRRRNRGVSRDGVEPMEVDLPPRDAPLPESPQRDGRPVRIRSTRVLLDSSDEETEEDKKLRGERVAAEKRRLEILEEARRLGMPPVIRPSIQGRKAVLEEAVPPAGPSSSNSAAAPVITTPGTPAAPEPAEPSPMEAIMLARINQLEELVRGAIKMMTAPPRATPMSYAQVAGETTVSATKGGKKGSATKNQPTSTKAGPKKEGPVAGTKSAPKAGGKGPDKRAPSQRATPPLTRSQKAKKEEAWTVVGRGGKGAGKSTAGTGGAKAAPKQQQKSNKAAAAAAKKKSAPAATTNKAATGAYRRKAPNSAAITITSSEGAYDDLLREARSKINLEELGLQAGLKPKRAQTGALILEVAGKDSAQKADLLAERLGDLYAGRPGVRVARPIKTGELRLLDLADSITGEEIAETVARKGKCPITQVQVGPLRRGPGGLNTVWVKCPLPAFNAILNDGGKLTVGWFAARARALEARPLQCFKCLEGGHVRAQCPNEADRSSRCYRCGDESHLARDCKAAPKCPVCADLGKPAGHRAGSKACSTAHKKGKRGRKPPPMNGVAPGNIRAEEKMDVEVLLPEAPRPKPKMTSVEEVNLPLVTGAKRKLPTKRSAKDSGSLSDKEERSEKPLPQRKRNRGVGGTEATGSVSTQTLVLTPEIAGVREVTEVRVEAEQNAQLPGDAPPTAPVEDEVHKEPELPEPARPPDAVDVGEEVEASGDEAL